MTGIAGPTSIFRTRDADLIGRIVRCVHQRTGTDFSHYRPDTLRRRILNRMICVSAASLDQYLDLLLQSQDEAQALLARLTIKVSRFYRNRNTFDLLRRHVIPELAGRTPARPLRVWSAGCGCGEEAWTLAMLLDEAGCEGIVEATDIDPQALHVARAGVYGNHCLEELPVDLAGHYLEPCAAGRRVTPALHARVRFGHDDLTRDVPGAGHPFDLVCCRNVLIYWRRPVQQRALLRLRRATAVGGFLCLGEAEWPAPGVARGLHALPHRSRVFRQVEPFPMEEMNES